MLVTPNRDGDQVGRIRNATRQEYSENPLGAFGKDVVHFFAGLVGLNTVDDEITKVRMEADNGGVKAGDVVLAAVTISMALSRGEEGGPIDVPGETNVQPYDVGMTKDLNSRSVVSDDISIHHSIQSQPGSQLIPEYDYKNAPGIALPKNEHSEIPTFRGTKTAGSPRQQLAKDIRDLRANTNAPNEKLQQLINLN
jgi:hypothetical protein